MISIIGPPPVDLISVNDVVRERQQASETLLEKTGHLKLALIEQRWAEREALRAGVPADEVKRMVSEMLAGSPDEML